MSKLAIGWSWGFTNISKNKKIYGYEKDVNITFSDGSTYKILNDNEDLTEDITLELQNYLLSDIKLTRVANTKEYILEYSNGTKEFFDGTYGNIIKREDVFGNYIIFEYEDIDYYRGSFYDYVNSPNIYKTQLHVLTKIIDSTGKIIEIKYNVKNNNTGTQINCIEICFQGETFTTINLERKKSYNGDVDVITEIVDAEQQSISFEYEEKIEHIFYSYDDYEVIYNVNGSTFAMCKINYPTGGYTKYEYTKARRAYAYYVPFVWFYDWYEVHKVSKRIESSGKETNYLYNGDRSGYPYSAIIENEEKTTGNVNDTSFEYNTIVKNDKTTTIHTFNYKHNKISTHTYVNDSSKNLYVHSVGTAIWDTVVNNQIYRVDKNDSFMFVYSQNENSSTPKMHTPYEVTQELKIVDVKSKGDKIYVFCIGDKNANGNSYKISTKIYDTINDCWSDGGGYIQTTETSAVTISATTTKIYYYNDMFYAFYYNKRINSDNELYLFKYDTAEESNNIWEMNKLTIKSSDDYSFDYLFQKNGKLYFKCRYYIYECDLMTATHNSYQIMDFGIGSVSGFVSGNKTFIYNSIDELSEFDLNTKTVVAKYTYPFNKTNIVAIQKGSDGYMYFFLKNSPNPGEQSIYKFVPEAEESWELVGHRIFNNGSFRILMSHNAVYMTLGELPSYTIQEDRMGIEKFVLESEAKGTLYEDKIVYNQFNQPIESSHIYHNEGKKKHISTETTTYVQGKNAIETIVDSLGNITRYEYVDSLYYIPTKITEFAGTDNEVVINNVLSADKTKILSSETIFDDEVEKYIFSYSNNYPGNKISEVKQHIKNNIMTTLSETEYIYDAMNLFVVTEKQNNISTNTNNLLTPNTINVSINYTYDNFGRLLSESDRNGNVTSYEYNNNGWLLNVDNPDDSYSEANYLFSNQLNKIVAEYNGQYVTINYYDGIGRIIKQCEKENGEEITLKTYQYDEDRLVKVVDANNNYISYSYDYLDRISDIFIYDRESNLLQHQSVEYDDFNLLKIVNTDGYDRRFYYDENGRLLKEEFETEVGTNTTTYEYDYANRLTKTTDAKGNVVENEYNDKGQLLSVTNELGQRTLYEYDSWGNVSKVTYSGGNSISYVYDRLGRLQKSTDALGNTEYYAYDNNNNLIAHKDRKGQVVTMTYDSMNRLVNKNAGTINISYTYNSFGSPLTMTDSTGTTSYAYTYNNRLSQITVPDGKSISYMYDVMGNVTNVNDYQNNNISYTYDGANRIDTILKNGSLMADYSYNANNSIASIAYAEGTVEYTYDEANNIKSVTNRLLYGNTLSDFNYTYDILGNVVKVQSYYPQNKQTLYTYDDLNRLSSVTENDGTVISYTFDAGNNITTKNIAHGSLTDEYSFKQDGVNHTISNITAHNVTYSYNIANQLIEETETVTGTGSTNTGVVEKVNLYTYDANGNRIKRETGGQVDESVVEYTYNELNQLCNYTNPDGLFYTIKYDGTGMRVSKEISNRVWKFYWDRGYVASEELPNGSNATNYIGAQGIFARTYDDEIRYLFKNGHGDVTNTVQYEFGRYSYEYDAYGNQEVLTGTAADPIRYCGEYIDAETGLIYLRNRYYDPSIGRFITEDPARAGLNWYVYCRNNPITFVDPLGLYELETDENGNVYAVIEQGDTLSGIAEAEVNDASAYTKITGVSNYNTIYVGQRINITEIYNDAYPIPTNIMLSKTRHTQGDSGLRDMSDEEVARRARDKSLSGKERQRYIGEEKHRKQRNKQKRQSHYITGEPELQFPNTSFLPTPKQATPKVNIPDSQFLGNVESGVITIVGVAAGIYYFCYTWDPSMIYQYVR